MTAGELWAILGPVLGLYVLLVTFAIAGFRWVDAKFDRIHQDFIVHLRDYHGIEGAGSKKGALG